MFKKTELRVEHIAMLMAVLPGVVHLACVAFLFYTWRTTYLLNLVGKYLIASLQGVGSLYPCL